MNDIILYFLFGFFLISGFLFISLFFDGSIDYLLVILKKIESFYKSEV